MAGTARGRLEGRHAHGDLVSLKLKCDHTDTHSHSHIHIHVPVYRFAGSDRGDFEEGLPQGSPESSLAFCVLIQEACLLYTSDAADE